MTSWNNFNNKSNSITPFISEIKGTALIGQPSEITIKGSNFIPDSQIICGAGEISNVRISPEEIIFDCIATTSGSYPVEIRNKNLSSNDWNRPASPILIARNSLNITNGWLDFRTANSAGFGGVTSHINQILSTKTFSNSGYTLDATRGLIFNNFTFTANSQNNYIQFNSFSFPLSASKLELFVNFETTFTTVSANRLRVGIGIPANNNILAMNTDFTTGNLLFSQRFISPYIGNSVLYFGSVNNNLLNNNFYYLKFIWDFIAKRIEIHKLSNNDLEAMNKIEELPINLLGRSTENLGVPLFNFYNSGSLSSVVAMKID
ncbi:hypothetical protein PCC9214_05335 [Planktothrix tepida]|uniref:IPT/TIG domain-containing protein n=1 Tax=Planktothrix tepida PCC 9214 TaxID=671072 RepID=A0A1J1LI19_9CYAN|nr:IPT/TIG domain-containing protein [Planktothrix tepida]CAD5984770.1 hypothetical protein PCC9214_05299 [Planktothrix tepida]CAD5985054.1 hypothetical protein PCC9214_05335 [Planktothrix tepida]CUR32152.1 hypothetical protein PL9214430124 [Planktothrix tepida PCC 9214]